MNRSEAHESHASRQTGRHTSRVGLPGCRRSCGISNGSPIRRRFHPSAAHRHEIFGGCSALAEVRNEGCHSGRSMAPTAPTLILRGAVSDRLTDCLCTGNWSSWSGVSREISGNVGLRSLLFFFGACRTAARVGGFSVFGELTD